jgi:Methyltransferase domain
MSVSLVPIQALRGDSWIDALDSLCRKYVAPSMTVVEIGSFGGESTSVFARYAGIVYAVDPWDASYGDDVLLGCAEGPVRDFILNVGLAPMSEIEAIFDRRISGAANVRKIKAFDQDAVASFADESIDVLYIDSIHTYESVKDTVTLWVPKVRRGGIISGHDFCPVHWNGVVAAVRELFGAPDEVFPDTSWVVVDAPSRLQAKLNIGSEIIKMAVASNHDIGQRE